jgi:hypothetical protein
MLNYTWIYEAVGENIGTHHWWAWWPWQEAHWHHLQLAPVF